MAHIHRTTMSPTKLELLDRWLPEQPWYAGSGRADVTRVGGFRLDDPAGDVGIEVMFVRDDASDDGTTYHVPMTYRGEPLPSAESALVGTREHGVLGPRFIYDGAHDPVLVAQLLALLHGAVEPQHQSQSDAVDPTVRVDNVRTGPHELASLDVFSDATQSVITAGLRGARDGDRREVTIRLLRVLSTGAPTGRATSVSAPWPLPDGTDGRGPVVVID